MKTIYDEALESVKTYRKLPEDEAFNIRVLFQESFPFYETGSLRIDWNKIKGEIMHSDNQVSDYDWISESDVCIVMWADFSYGLIEASLIDIFNAKEDVFCSFETWIFCVEKKYVIEDSAQHLMISYPETYR